MTFDENDFFRQATLRICGDIDIENAMVSFLQYMQGQIPADMLFLLLFDKSIGVVRTIVKATPQKGERKDILTPITPEARGYLKKKYDPGMPEAYFYNEPHEAPVSREVLAHHGETAESLLVLPLETSQHPIGAIVLLSKERQYDEEHARLMTLLKEPFSVAMLNALRHMEVVKLKDLLADDNRYLHRELHQMAGKEIIGGEFGLKPVMDMVRQVASLDSPVLLLGETGVGKDVIANAIHYSSSRRDGPFITVNSGAIPDTLIDSELFGHERGAFSGALSMKRGRFERAHKGTIFLDEIGELPPPAQVRMLRVLQEKEIERIGGSKTLPVDIRIIAATNRDLEQMVEEGTFRKDLWFRLNVFPILIPPLGDRREDIPALVTHFIERKARAMRLGGIPKLAEGAIETLMAYDWPGNVRELDNIVERALILNPEGPLRFDSLIKVDPQTVPTPPGESDDLDMDAAIARHIRRVLELTGGKVHGKGGAAERMGMNPSTLRGRMRKLGIEFKRDGKG